MGTPRLSVVVTPPNGSDHRVPDGSRRSLHHVRTLESAGAEEPAPVPTGEHRSHCSSPLSSLCVSRHHPGGPDGRATALQHPRSLPRLLLAARSRPSACSRLTIAGPRVTDPTAGGTSPVRCDLRPTAHVARKCDLPELARHVPPSRGATITTAVTPSFRGPERGSCSPTTPCGLFAVRPRVFRRTHWQRLGGALVVELFVFPLFLHGIPDSCRRAGPAGFPVGYSPRQQGYADVTGLAPELPRGCRPRPPDGILTRFESHRPVRPKIRAAGVSWSPPFRGPESLGRTVRLFRRVIAVGVCRTEPPSHWASQSPGNPALRAGTHIAVGDRVPSSVGGRLSGGAGDRCRRQWRFVRSLSTAERCSARPV